MERGFQYCEDIKSGKILSGINIKKAVERFEKDLLRKDLTFIEEKVQAVIDFIALQMHFTGKHAGKPFILEPWQVFLVMNLYGFFYVDSGLRRFNNAYIEMARKGGKTAMGAVISLYHLIADGESDAMVLLAANSKEQAKIAYDITRKFARKFDSKENYLRTFRGDIFYDKADSQIKVIAADSSKLDGYNCSMGMVDEYHSAPNAQVRDVIRSSMGMRENPMLYTVTTAGFDKSLPCYELRTVCTEIVSGLKEDDGMFVMIFSMDNDDDWKDEKNWIKSNPNLGVTVSIDFLRKQVTQAINSPSDEVGVRTKNFNEWMDSATTWIPDEYLLKATKKVDIQEFTKKDCFIGVDLASVQDLTAVSYLYVEDEIYHFHTKYYLPHESLRTRPDRDQYAFWQKYGYLITTGGNVTDYDYITKDMLDVDASSVLRHVYYDSYNATQWAVQSTEEGLPLQPYSQTVANFNAPTRALERLLLSGKVIIDDNPITRYCFRNVELKQDHNGNVKPNKGINKKKIDGVIAMIQALAAYIENQDTFTGQIY